jgi:hypothetical protein
VITGITAALARMKAQCVKATWKPRDIAGSVRPEIMVSEKNDIMRL